MNHKKALALLLALALVFSMAACTKKNEESSGEATDGDLPVYSQGITEDGFFEGVTAKDYVTLGQYEGIEIPAAELEITDAEIDAQIQDLLSSHSETKEVTDRAAQLGDTVNIDYEGYMDGEQFDGGTGNNPSLTLGSGSFIAGFEDGIVGHEVGDAFDLELSFPDPYPNNPDLAGKPVTFKVTLNSISESVVPELTDASIKELFEEENGWTSIADMRAEVKEGLEEDAKYNYVFAQIEDFEVSEVPESVFQYEAANMKAYYEQMASMYSMTLDDFVAGMGIGTMDDIVEQAREQLTASGRSTLIYQAIAEDKGITVTQEDIDAEFADTDEDTYKQIVDYYGMPYIKMVLLGTKVADVIMDSAVVK